MAAEIIGLSGIKFLAIVIELGNVALLSGLLYLYGRSYNQIKIGFTIGLILFALALLMRSIFTIAFVMLDSDALIGRPIYIGGLIEFIALTILLKITWDY
jgi:hypothetical protein